MTRRGQSHTMPRLVLGRVNGLLFVSFHSRVCIMLCHVSFFFLREAFLGDAASSTTPRPVYVLRALLSRGVGETPKHVRRTMSALLPSTCQSRTSLSVAVGLVACPSPLAGKFDSVSCPSCNRGRIPLSLSQRKLHPRHPSLWSVRFHNVYGIHIDDRIPQGSILCLHGV